MWGLCTGQACVRVWPFGGGRRLAGWLRGRERRLPKAFHRACQRGSAEQEIRASTAAAGQVVPTGHDRAIPGSELLAALTTSRRSPGWCPVPVTGVCVPCGRSSPAANCCAGSAGVPGECEACVLRDQGGRWQGRDREPLRTGMPHIEHVPAGALRYAFVRIRPCAIRSCGMPVVGLCGTLSGSGWCLPIVLLAICWALLAP